MLTNLPRLPLTLEQYKTQYPNETLSAADLDGIARTEVWLNTGRGYFNEQATKVFPLYAVQDLVLTIYQPSTVGLALFDSPVGQLSWIGQLMHDCELFLSVRLIIT